jgi:hypothetical protein
MAASGHRLGLGEQLFLVLALRALDRLDVERRQLAIEDHGVGDVQQHHLHCRHGAGQPGRSLDGVARML